jgi:hypothetical protein
MTNDLDLVKQLEKEIGIKLKQVPLEMIGKKPLTAFAKDDNGNVKGLSIFKVKLTGVPAVLTKFQKLEKLFLYDTQIKDISSLKELKGLKELYLHVNQISDISCLKELKGLTFLNLYKNQISDISSLKELRNLKRLVLTDNKISHLPAEFLDLGMEIKWKWNDTDGIFLHGNPLESPPAEIIKKGNDAIRQYFKSLLKEEKASLKQLEKEIGNELEQIPLKRIGEDPLTAFAKDDNGHMKGVSIFHLILSRVPAILSKFQRLEKLVLVRNQISDISSLKELKGITYLNLGGNQISDISSLKELKNLKILYLGSNKISQLPAEFLDMGMEIKWEYDYKDGIFLEGNPLESPPVEIIKQGNDAIRQYFKSLEGEKQALKQRPSDKIDKELFFISYSRKDEDFVLHLCKKLKEVGVEIWLDQWDIAPGDNWDKSIDEALFKCTRMLIILSPDAVDSKEVQSELYTFFNDDKPVIPIVYRSCRIPRRLNVIQHINFTSSDLGNKNKIEELVKLITK